MPRKHKSSAPAAPRPLAGPQRLNKLLAAAGLGSRRQVEQYIVEGRIEVDGQAVTDLATKVDPEDVKLTFDGSAIKIFRPVYFALNKPVGVLSTNRDPSGRMRAIDLINVKERIFSAGRLDRSSEGLMLLTNDGELAQRLSHPRFGIQKLYLATVQGEVTQADLEKLIRGVRLSEGYAKVDAVKVRRQRSGAAELEIALSEGKNREIRRILARLGHKVVALKRLAIGPLRLGLLPAGGWRPLTRTEIDALYNAAVVGRRKKRGTGKPLRGKPLDDTSGKPPQLVAGQFDRFNDDDDDYPSLEEYGDDDEIIALNDESVIGTVIPYSEDGEEENEDNYVDGFGEGFNSDGDEGDDDEGFDDELEDGFGDDEVVDEEYARNSRRGGGARSPGGRGASGKAKPSGRSPHDIRSRKSSSGTGSPRAGAMRSSDRSEARPPRSVGPRSSAPRTSSGPRSGGGTSGGIVRAGGRKAGVKSTRSSAPRAGGTKRSTGRPFKSGTTGSRPSSSSSSGPRSAGPRTSSSAPRTGASRGPSKGGPSRSGSGPGRSGPGKSGPGAGPRAAGPRSGGPRSSGPRSGDGGGPRGGSGPRSGGGGSGGSGPKRGGGGGPKRGGPSRGKR